MSASCDKPHHVGLEPMRHLVEHLHWGCTDQAQQVWLLEAVLSEHAHELAEKIRTSRPEPPEGFTWSESYRLGLDDSRRSAADLIDPEVRDG